MRKRITQALALCMMTCVMFATSANHKIASEQIPVEEEIVDIEPIEIPTIVKYDTPFVATAIESEKSEEVMIEVQEELPKEPPIPQEDIDLISIVTMAEAEGESELGKRLVIDTILNRMDSEEFPDTVNGVIYQKNAFECVWNGRANKCYVTEDIRQLVLEELESRTNSDVIYFQAKHYSSYGTPLFQEDHHYFSSK